MKEGSPERMPEMGTLLMFGLMAGLTAEFLKMLNPVYVPVPVHVGKGGK